MNILMISPVPIQPADAGDRVRIKHIAQGLARFHSITLVVPVQDKFAYDLNYESNHHTTETTEDIDLTYLPILIKSTGYLKKIAGLFSKWPYHTSIRYSQEVATGISGLIAENKYDLIYCHFLQTLPYVLPSKIPIILDQHNVDYVYWERQIEQYENPVFSWLAKRNLTKTIQFEQAILSDLSGIVSVSEKDKKLTQQYAFEKVDHFLVTPNGVDTAEYSFLPKLNQTKELVLGFFGSMDLKYNEDAAIQLIQEILPRVQEQLPDKSCSVMIIGRNPTKKIKTLAQKSKYVVTVTGSVVAIPPYLQQVDLLVLPLASGAGTKLRIPESLAAGVCIVTNQLTIEGFEDMKEEEHFILANKQEEFVNKICKIALHKEKRYHIVNTGRELVEKKYSWNGITASLARQLERLYISCDTTL